ncbi:arylsulfatase [Aquiflexum gelatinilyticum]|uniref:Arylsulfatase n=1 Tax=Aquiflexum gelatinilyticum TaxID=2961943 RepID=A0A9X2SZN5_9BACT|nr:arylsulfatase [Aquiflexum gelatinilyticum]MCR9014121.1 arylsulfatase [Aquiflexum gelatinilyticum]
MKFTPSLCFLLLFAWLFFSSCQVKPTPPKPNVLLIITDDQGWGDLSFHGNKLIETPNIDSLASQSIVFDRFYVSPVCAPTRASLLTGRYHPATGTTWVTHRMEVMREEELTIAEILQSNGYRTGLFGKWHQGKQFPHDPIGQGFEEFLGFTEGHLNNYFDSKLTHNFEEVPFEGYLPDFLTDKTVDFMEGEAPFFAMISFNTPHSPFQVPDSYFDKYKVKGLSDKDAAVYGMVENIDDNIGKLMSFLKQSGKLDNTIVIFMTDNGPNGVRFNGGMKGTKAHLDEGGVRVPFFMRIPGQDTQVIKPWAAHIDVLPTLMDILEIKIAEEIEVHGKSLLPLIKGNPQWEDRYFFTHHVNQDFDTIPGAIRNQKYLLTLQKNKKELYDLENDYSQNHNILVENTQLAELMEKEYLAWFQNVTKKGITPPLIQVGHAHVPRIELPAPDGKMEGGVMFKGKMGWANDWFVGFSSEADRVSWDIETVQDSDYEIYLQLSNAAPFQIILEMNEDEWEIEVPKAYFAEEISSPDRVPRGEVTEKKWPLVPLGKKRFEKGPLKLALGTKGGADANLEIKSVILKRVD